MTQLFDWRHARSGDAASGLRWALAALAMAAAPSISLAAPAVATAKDPGQPAAASTPAGEASFEARLRALYPSQKFDAIRPAPLPGFWEVTMGQSIAYVENSGRYFLFGGLWDMQTKRDLSAERRAELDRIDVQQLPLANAIVYGNGPRTVHVFADPNCGYCKQLEATLSQIQGLRVVVHPTPILGEASVEAVHRIWCAPDRAAAWRQWMLEGVSASNRRADCQAPVEAFSQLAAQHRVVGTPMLVSADGRKLSGALPLAQLVAWLGAADSHARSSAAPNKVNSLKSPKTPALPPSAGLADAASRL